MDLCACISTSEYMASPTWSKANEPPHKYDPWGSCRYSELGGPGQRHARRPSASCATFDGPVACLGAPGAVTVLCQSAALPENAARLDAIMLGLCDAPNDLREGGLAASAAYLPCCPWPRHGVGGAAQPRFRPPYPPPPPAWTCRRGAAWFWTLMRSRIWPAPRIWPKRCTKAVC